MAPPKAPWEHSAQQGLEDEHFGCSHKQHAHQRGHQRNDEGLPVIVVAEEGKVQRLHKHFLTVEGISDSRDMSSGWPAGIDSEWDIPAQPRKTAPQHTLHDSAHCAT
jgi:hypothetical protein